jgi:hypothetical protein
MTPPLEIPMESPIESLTPVLVVDRIEPSLPFWEEGLGFQRLAEVPHEDHLGFVMLGRGSVMVMLQTRASVEADLPVGAGPFGAGPTFLFVKVPALDPFVDSPPPGSTVAVPRRTTFYGMDEIGYRTPDGTIVVLAADVPTSGGEEQPPAG